jgi:hypothetical protein
MVYVLVSGLLLDPLNGRDASFHTSSGYYHGGAQGRQARSRSLSDSRGSAGNQTDLPNHRLIRTRHLSTPQRHQRFQHR